MTHAEAKLAYTVKEACTASTFGETKLREETGAGRLKVKCIGGRIVIPADELKRFVDSEV